MAGNKISKCRVQIGKYKNGILTGKMLVIDPSSGSKSSMPGYAIFHKGEFQEDGVIQVPIYMDLHRRLCYLSTCLRQFDVPDILVVERISARAHGRHAAAHASLLKSVGAIFASISTPKLVEITPMTWKAYIKYNPQKCADYSKADNWDARVMGMYAVDVARGDYT